MSVTAYLELPLALPGLQEGEVNNPDKVVTLKVIPQQVVAYHAAYFPECSIIYLANGQPFLLSMTVLEYEKAIEKYISEVNKHLVEENKRQELRRNLKPMN